MNSCDWHPWSSLIVSGSSDATVPSLPPAARCSPPHFLLPLSISRFKVKLWDARVAEKSGLLLTLRHHKQAVSKVRWNKNGNWLLTCGADGKANVFDIRTGKEIYSADAAAGITAAQWHPVNELVFATGTREVAGRVGSSLEQWVIGHPEPQFQIHDAHHKKVRCRRRDKVAFKCLDSSCRRSLTWRITRWAPCCAPLHMTPS